MKALIALKFLAWRTKQNLREGNVKIRKNVPYSQSQNIGILFTVTDKEKHEVIKHFIHLLEKDHKQVKTLTFLETGKENYEFRFDFFEQKDISLSGKINSTLVEDFIAKEFDFLYHLDLDVANPAMENILSLSRARCRIGLYKKDKEPFYELMLQPKPGKGLKEVVEEVYHYTKELTKNDTVA